MEETSENPNTFVFQATAQSSQTPAPKSHRLQDIMDKRHLQDTLRSDCQKRQQSICNTGQSPVKRLRTPRINVTKDANSLSETEKQRANQSLNNTHHQSMENATSEHSCQLCGAGERTFQPPIYCKPCGGLIKRNETYYTHGSGAEAWHLSCFPPGPEYPKTMFKEKKNNEEAKELWIQCDKCEAWQHQMCALYNGRRNEGRQQKYTCLKCYKGDQLAETAVLGAKDLPRTILSDHIEQRLFKRLSQEKQERAWFHGKSIDEIPGAEPLVVRVVSSADKLLEVNRHFQQIFHHENYPSELPYKSKVILLFQEIEGVEVCLFGIHAQEFGSECQNPNNRAVYISYLDSVKYFRPEIRTVSGEALRTFVYHEILIGYLEYCKLRGFTSCHIWMCPPLKDDEYIFHCHPEIQKTPESHKLREWFWAMLRKASKENIVIELTNLYDLFFISAGESKAKVTASRLPYFDGDFWPCAAEDILNQIREEEEGIKKLQKKGVTKRIISKRALISAADPAANASKDVVLMQKLGETIRPMKEDFIVVHLQHSCSHCRKLMVSGNRWVCISCNKFQLCDKCYGVEQKLEDKDKHPIDCKDKHVFHPVEIRDVAQDTKDKDEILESEFFDTRQSFLSLCRGSNYRFDTLRWAKHSSMMTLHHLHNPTQAVFVTTCNMCQQEAEAGDQIWWCSTCPNYDVCNSCFQKHGGANHPHQLTIHTSTTPVDAQNLEARQIRFLKHGDRLNSLVHASQCRDPQCQYRDCHNVKGLFRHGIQCKKRATGGCILCKKMWYLLQLHAKSCKNSECHVSRCRDLKEHLKMLQEQCNTRRKAAVMEMMRQKMQDSKLAKMDDTMDAEDCYVPKVVVDKMSHLSIAEGVLLDTMDAQHCG